MSSCGICSKSLHGISKFAGVCSACQRNIPAPTWKLYVEGRLPFNRLVEIGRERMTSVKNLRGGKHGKE